MFPDFLSGCVCVFCIAGIVTAEISSTPGPPEEGVKTAGESDRAMKGEKNSLMNRCTLQIKAERTTSLVKRVLYTAISLPRGFKVLQHVQNFSLEPFLHSIQMWEDEDLHSEFGVSHFLHSPCCTNRLTHGFFFKSECNYYYYWVHRAMVFIKMWLKWRKKHFKHGIFLKTEKQWCFLPQIAWRCGHVLFSLNRPHP